MTKRKRLPIKEWLIGEMEIMTSHGYHGVHGISRIANEVLISTGHDEILSAWKGGMQRLHLGGTSVDVAFVRALAEQKADAEARAMAESEDPQVTASPQHESSLS